MTPITVHLEVLSRLRVCPHARPRVSPLHRAWLSPALSSAALYPGAQPGHIFLPQCWGFLCDWTLTDSSLQGSDGSNAGHKDISVVGDDWVQPLFA